MASHSGTRGKARIIEEVENSLRRLQTDVIDLYQIHWPDPNTPIAEVAEAMGALHRAGKIRAIGVSNFSPAQMDEFRKVAPLHTAQPPYNLFERAIDRDVLPYCRDHDIAMLAYGSLCRGLLSGRMSESSQFTGDDLRKSDPKFQAPRFVQYLAAVEQLDRVAKERFGKRVIHLAVRWVLDRNKMNIALWGARRADQLSPIGNALGWKIDSQAMAEIDQILRETIKDPVGPGIHGPSGPRRGVTFKWSAIRSRSGRRTIEPSSQCKASAELAADQATAFRGQDVSKRQFSGAPSCPHYFQHIGFQNRSEEPMNKKKTIRVVNPEQFDLGTAQTPGSERRAAVCAGTFHPFGLVGRYF